MFDDLKEIFESMKTNYQQANVKKYYLETNLWKNSPLVSIFKDNTENFSTAFENMNSFFKNLNENNSNFGLFYFLNLLKSFLVNLENMKKTLKENFGVNIEEEPLQEHLKQFLDKENGKFYFLEYCEEQKKKVFEEKFEDFSLSLNEVIILCVSFWQKKEFDKKNSCELVENLMRENGIFDFLK